MNLKEKLVKVLRDNFNDHELDELFEQSQTILEEALSDPFFSASLESGENQ